jgi:3-ketoacyl-CoA synthase
MSTEEITISEKEAKKWTDAFNVDRSTVKVKPRSCLYFLPYKTLALFLVIIPCALIISLLMYLHGGEITKPVKVDLVSIVNNAPSGNQWFKKVLPYYVPLRQYIVNSVLPDSVNTKWLTPVDTLSQMNTITSEQEALTILCFSFALGYFIVFTVLSIVFRLLFRKVEQPVYLVDFTTLRVDDGWVDTTGDWFIKKIRALKGKVFNEESISLMEKVAAKGCISNLTAYPKFILDQKLDEVPPSYNNIDKAREEAEYVFNYIVGGLLKSTGLKPTDIDILVVNCSVFCPTPSLAAMIIKNFQMREDVLAYNLGGMGCSAGMIAIDLAKDILKVHQNKRALVVSTENLTQCWYLGNEKSFLLQNTLFRLGGAAILLSNIANDKYRSKYEFVDCVRIHRGRDDLSYNSIVLSMDKENIQGVKLTRDVISCATKAVTKNLTSLLLRNLSLIPIAELVKSVLSRMLSKKSYIPNFPNIFDHFCIHAGGRRVLDDMGETLRLGDKLIPSRAALFRFGNTSSASPWYELEYIENTRSIKSGHTVLQLAFGSGFKCNSVVWRRL